VSSWGRCLAVEEHRTLLHASPWRIQKGFVTGRETSARTSNRGSFNANAETIAVGTELAWLELGTGASGGDRDFVENRKPPVRRRRLVLPLQHPGELGDIEICIYHFPTLESCLGANFFIESKV
jgi:hypothetical protein